MKTRLLIIEDDAAIAQLHHRYLSQLEGFEVVGIAMSQADARLQMEVLNLIWCCWTFIYRMERALSCCNGFVDVMFIAM